MKYKLLKDLPFAKVGEVFERVTHKSEENERDWKIYFGIKEEE